jgi:hypothetical protein
MYVTQLNYSQLTASDPIAADLVFVFGKRERLSDTSVVNSITSFFKGASVVFSSGSGEIRDAEVVDDDLVVTSLKFNQKCFRVKTHNIIHYKTSYEAGQTIGFESLGEDTQHLLLFADGSLVNGSELVRGVNSVVPRSISVSGGLAGDGTSFEKTLVGVNSDVKEGNIVAVELYGEKIRVSTGCNGGWKPFGPFRKVTKAVDNVLYEIDNQPALDLYKNYLGDRAKELPGSALLFPLAISDEPGSTPVVRTILSINEPEKSMTFAGNMPVHSSVRLMMANKEDLIDAAGKAADDSVQHSFSAKPAFALLVSCVGRRLALGTRTEEELELIREKLGAEVVMTGFYSYGEISAGQTGEGCNLHNQTMAITLIGEND